MSRVVAARSLAPPLLYASKTATAEQPEQQQQQQSKAAPSKAAPSRVVVTAPVVTKALVALEPFDVIATKRLQYCGPTDESNWVLPGRLMVGAFPGMPDDRENERLLTAILRSGITTFVCLQREYDPKASEALWRSGAAIRPYFKSAVEVAGRLDRQQQHPSKLSKNNPRVMSFIHFGIVDCSTVEDDAVLHFARDLAYRIRTTDEVVYLHCWGGHGRTGTVVCLLLHILYGLDATQALYRCQFVHDLRRIPIAVGSPQTASQRDQVVRIINRLIQQRESEAAQRNAAAEASLLLLSKTQRALPLLSNATTTPLVLQQATAIAQVKKAPSKADDDLRPAEEANTAIIVANDTSKRPPQQPQATVCLQQPQQQQPQQRLRQAPPTQPSTQPPGRKPSPAAGRRIVSAAAPVEEDVSAAAAAAAAASVEEVSASAPMDTTVDSTVPKAEQQQQPPATATIATAPQSSSNQAAQPMAVEQNSFARLF